MPELEQDIAFMQQALALAEKGLGSVEPNPAVGCLIVQNGKIVGSGFHRFFGGPHAEIEALSECRSRGVDPRGATAYVTLEPCDHFGKTPPCTQALIKAGIKRVVIAAQDPSGGRAGIAVLKAAGISITEGVCNGDAIDLNRPFLKYASTGRCYVTLKWAQSLDARIGWVPVCRKWISSEASRRDVHLLRRRVQAIVAGINTVLVDNPMLTPRPSNGKKPLRVVLDSDLRIRSMCALLKTAQDFPVLVACSKRAARFNSRKLHLIEACGAEVVPLAALNGMLDLKGLLKELSTRDVRHVLVEGGPTVHRGFLAKKLADEVIVYVAPLLLGRHGTAATNPVGGRWMQLREVRFKQIGDDMRITGLLSLK